MQYSKLFILLFFTSVLYACKSTPIITEYFYSHPVHGEVNKNNAKYIEATEVCGGKYFSKGLIIKGSPVYGETALKRVLTEYRANEFEKFKQRNVKNNKEKLRQMMELQGSEKDPDYIQIIQRKSDLVAKCVRDDFSFTIAGSNIFNENTGELIEKNYWNIKHNK